ncbi:hypothetical protein [Paeniglutamicibacter sp. Y32M11]|jgi:hypothetical protein|uniref:hypothetical protein n=1 Tax=Paeniglutamicibacter sp. Y32M11 TaxID=2853258 RepID=UPI001C527C91|nr:hypothetical protein [Paeniglutamicibacter sp. Y32M11]QXQ10725.1 hypothetical protein KUF55_01895 [Paeniglutamicibacter sp. Y32M11]
MTTIMYEAPTVFTANETAENGVIPIIAALAGAVSIATGASIGHVVWVCSQCPDKCRSFSQAVNTVKSWWGAGC